MANKEFGIIASLDIPKSTIQIEKDLKTIEKNLQSKQIKIDAKINTDKIVNNAKQVVEKVNQSFKAINTNEIFNAKTLDNEGRKYFTKTTQILDQVKKYYLKNGALKVDVSNIENANGRVQSFSAIVEQSTGVIKKFNYEKGKINTGGSTPNYGFVQTPTVSSVDKNSGANLQSTLNFLNKIDSRMSDINSKALNQTNPLLQGTQQYDNYINKLNETKTNIENIKNANQTLSNDHKRQIGLMVDDLKRYSVEQEKAAYPPNKLASKSLGDNVKIETSDLDVLKQTWKQQGLLVGEFDNKVKQLYTDLNNINSPQGLVDYKTKLSQVKNEATQLNKELNNQLSLEKMATNINKAKSSLEIFRKELKANKVNDYTDEINRLTNSLDNVKSPKELQNINAQIGELKTRAKALGNVGDTFFSKLKKNLKQFSQFLISGSLIMTAVRGVRNMISEVKNLDDAMTNLYKVTNNTQSAYNKFLTSAISNAKTLGSSVSQIVESTADFARLGYSLNEASELAKSAVLYSNVGDISVSEGTQSIISTLKAYNIEAKNSIEIVDKLNEVNKPAPLRLIA